jgi:regulator of sirC expression with transglutaminase-like and TPR domain
MNSTAGMALPEGLSPSQGRALLNLLADEDPAVYQPVREKIISCGPPAAEWLRPHTMSDDPALRRRAQEIVLHFDRHSADDTFLAFCLRHGEDLDLEQGALMLAQTRYPSINPEAYRALLDTHAGELRERIDFGSEPKEILGAINQHLFGELGYAGNEQDYYNPENSYLSRVMDRRTGNPINLCLVYILLARRLHLPVAGIGLPGHFICRYQSSSAEVYFDPFYEGRFLSKGDCVRYLTRGNYSLRDDYLTPVTPRRLLLRICGNLHQVYQRLEQASEAMRLQRYLVALAR